MRIAFFTDTYEPQVNGVTVSINNFVNKLREQGHEVYVFAPKLKNYKDRDKNVFRLRSFKAISGEPEARVPFLFPEKSLREMFRKDFDLVHGHGNGAFSFLGYQIAKIKNIPYFLTFHTLHAKYTHYFLNGRVIKPKAVEAGFRVYGNLCDGVITPSEKMKRELLKYGVHKPIKIIPNFVDFSGFGDRPRGYLRKQLNLTEDTPILLSVGRLGREKNFDFLIKVFEKLTEFDNLSHLVIVGQGLEKDKLQEQIDQLGLTDRIHLFGQVEASDMGLVYADADIFVFPSDTETQGLVVLEASLSGLPIVVVEDLAFKDTVLEGKTGFYLPLVEKLWVEKINILLLDKNLRLRFGENGSLMAKDQFNPDLITAELVAFYQETIEAHKQKKRLIRKLVDKVALERFLKATEKLNNKLGFK